MKKLVLNCNLLGSKYEILHECIRHYSRLNDKQETHVWKALTVKFFEFTSKNNVPRFPVGVSIRDYE